MREFRILLTAAVCLLLSSPAARADMPDESPQSNPVVVGAGIALCAAAVCGGLYFAKRRKARTTKAASSEESDSK